MKRYIKLTSIALFVLGLIFFFWPSNIDTLYGCKMKIITDKKQYSPGQAIKIIFSIEADESRTIHFFEDHSKNISIYGLNEAVEHFEIHGRNGKIKQHNISQETPFDIEIIAHIKPIDDSDYVTIDFGPFGSHLLMRPDSLSISARAYPAKIPFHDSIEWPSFDEITIEIL